MAYSPNIALSATGNTTGPATVLGSYRSKLSFQVALTGSPSGGTVTLQGSLDGVTFDTTNALATFTIGSDTSGAIKFVIDKPVYAYRVVLAGLTGGTNPTVTAIVGVDMNG